MNTPRLILALLCALAGAPTLADAAPRGATQVDAERIQRGDELIATLASTVELNRLPLEALRFEAGSAQLTASSRKHLATVAGQLAAHPDSVLALAPNDDGRRLVASRLRAVHAALTEAGADPAQVVALPRDLPPPNGTPDEHDLIVLRGCFAFASSTLADEVEAGDGIASARPEGSPAERSLAEATTTEETP